MGRLTLHQAKDYGRLRKSDYVEGVLSHLNWGVVQERLERALPARRELTGVGALGG